MTLALFVTRGYFEAVAKATCIKPAFTREASTEQQKAAWRIGLELGFALPLSHVQASLDDDIRRHCRRRRASDSVLEEALDAADRALKADYFDSPALSDARTLIRLVASRPEFRTDSAVGWEGRTPLSEADLRILRASARTLNEMIMPVSIAVPERECRSTPEGCCA